MRSPLHSGTRVPDAAGWAEIASSHAAIFVRTHFYIIAAANVNCRQFSSSLAKSAWML
jgi:hypothetical protein